MALAVKEQDHLYAFMPVNGNVVMELIMSCNDPLPSL